MLPPAGSARAQIKNIQNFYISKSFVFGGGRTPALHLIALFYFVNLRFNFSLHFARVWVQAPPALSRRDISHFCGKAEKIYRIPKGYIENSEGIYIAKAAETAAFLRRVAAAKQRAKYKFNQNLSHGLAANCCVISCNYHPAFTIYL